MEIQGGNVKLLVITLQSGFDFNGIFECEFCHSYQHCFACYNDENFHNNVVPAIKCVSCGRRSSEIISNRIGDPGTQGGLRVVKTPVQTYQWEYAE